VESVCKNLSRGKDGDSVIGDRRCLDEERVTVRCLDEERVGRCGGV
jgi:hypothetical protein